MVGLCFAFLSMYVDSVYRAPCSIEVQPKERNKGEQLARRRPPPMSTMFHLLVLAQSLQRLEMAARATGSLQAQATLCEVAATILKAGSNAAPPCTSEAPCPAVASEPGSCEPSSICGCSTVLTSGCPSCPKTLQDLIVPSLQQRYCASDQDCNAPRGRCRRGRCRCAPGWGLRNCSFDNGATGGSDPHFSERVYSGYYSNLTFAGKTLASPTESRHSRGTSLSGPGSNAEETAGVRTVLPVLLSLMRVRTVLDVPCGDFNYMREVLSAAATPPGIVSGLGYRLVVGGGATSHVWHTKRTAERPLAPPNLLWPIRPRSRILVACRPCGGARRTVSLFG